MSLLQKLTVGKTPSPPRILLYGDAGVGKSSFAATAPKPVILVLEDGLDQIDCAKTPHIKDFATFIAYLKEIRDELTEEGRKFTFLCGHDANIASVLAALAWRTICCRRPWSSTRPSASSW